MTRKCYNKDTTLNKETMEVNKLTPEQKAWRAPKMSEEDKRIADKIAQELVENLNKNTKD